MRINKQASVAIIILNWGGDENTLELLEDFKKITYPNYYIFVVDPLESLDSKKFNKKNITLLFPKTNLGFSGNNNFAIKKILKQNFEYILLINNDTAVEPNFLEKLVMALEENPKAAASAPTILYYNSKQDIWFAGGELLLKRGEVRHKGIRQRLTSISNSSPQPNSFLTGCCLLMRVEAIKKIGLFDDDMFAYWEDADWCVRAQEQGYMLLYVPQAIIEHKVSMAMGVNSPSYLYYVIRNNLLFIRKHVPRKWRWLAWLVLFKKALKEVVKLFIRYKKDYKLYFTMIGRAFYDNAKRRYGKL